MKLIGTGLDENPFRLNGEVGDYPFAISSRRMVVHFKRQGLIAKIEYGRGNQNVREIDNLMCVRSEDRRYFPRLISSGEYTDVDRYGKNDFHYVIYPFYDLHDNISCKNFAKTCELVRKYQIPDILPYNEELFQFGVVHGNNHVKIVDLGESFGDEWWNEDIYTHCPSCGIEVDDAIHP